MAQYALLDGKLQPVSARGQRAHCHDQNCNWEMIAKPGNGNMLPHWAHRPGSKHIIGSGEKGEWHQEVQNLFKLAGAITEVHMRSADGTRDHYADIVCPDGRIVEAQTHYLNIPETESREATYGDMAWIYDARDTHAWFVTDDTRDPARFTWGNPDRRFFSHAKPIFFDTGHGIWQLERMDMRHVKGTGGRPRYEGVRTLVADNLLDFVNKVMAGKPFGKPARLTAIDPRKNNRGTRFRTLQDPDEWLAENEHCDYDGDDIELDRHH